ncbi:TetR/AcrR family transcriptional regulator [Zhihengliuella flava]|uniref:AcrR family transcriptional regulator n=1 Tax=Zhihengliuella flava TaxID=1285193 RepID=A0A931D8F3_9MICC|nr:AcrR family transcriptional regulator [Zhihengliuella flava]
MTTPPHSVSRREQNKAATRAAIVEAALDLVRRAPTEPVTAESIAEAANISRRTFFNYFSSVEAALNVPLDDFLESAVAHLATGPESLPAAEAAIRALRESFTPERLEPVAELFLLAQTNPQLSRMQMESWNDCAERVVDFLRTAAPDAPALASAAFAHAVVGVGRAAFLHWGQRFDDAAVLDSAPPSAHRFRPDHEATEELHELLLEAMTQLRDGFSALQTRAQ